MKRKPARFAEPPPQNRYRVHRERSAMTSNPFYWYRLYFGTVWSLGASVGVDVLSRTMARRIAAFLNRRKRRRPSRLRTA